MRLDSNPIYPSLKSSAQLALQERMLDYFESEPNRFEHFSIQGPHVLADFSKNLISESVRRQLIQLAETTELQSHIRKLFEGQEVNFTEQRPALHTALRALTEPKLRAADSSIHDAVTSALEIMDSRIDALHSGVWLGSTGKKLTQLVSIGIGGSYLGPKMVIEGLRHYHIDGLETFFVSNIDGSDVANVLPCLNPETTIFLIQSKSFTTLETLENAIVCIDWLKAQLGDDCDISKHLLAVSSNIEKAVEFGVKEENIFPMWDWVGGRYSMWSAIGFPVAFQLGFDQFKSLLRGAEEMDSHFYHAEPGLNIPVMLALVGIWNRSFLGHASLAVIPYDHQLRFLPEHLQQLDMESNGKTVDYEGKQIDYASGPLLFGGAGTNGQHAYHQLFHQGRGAVPIDFILAKRSPYPIRSHHAHLVANCLAQSRALMTGKTEEQALNELLDSGVEAELAQRLAPHKAIHGNKPSNVLLVDMFTPASVGALIAMYEHKIFVQGIIWGINSFDQWGVELGKVLERELFPLLTGDKSVDDAELDASTAALIQHIIT